MQNKINIQTEKVDDWPKLAWVAHFDIGSFDLTVYHGSMVEIQDNWMVEAVWAGEFEDGDFDKTDLVFGTGIRLRQDAIVFVSSGTMMDRLWRCSVNNTLYIGNSLPAVLAISGDELRDGYLNYPEDMKTQMGGVDLFKSKIPSVKGELYLTYYKNIVYDGQSIIEIDKPDQSPDFEDFQTYNRYLNETARALKKNFESPHRLNKIFPLSTLSKGYDSCASAAIMREAGVNKAVSIRNASSLLPRNDSGCGIGKYLDIECSSYVHAKKLYRRENTIWSAAGDPAGLNLTIFNYPKPLCVFFTGYRGDSVWQRERLDRSYLFRARSLDGLSLTEFRLHEGIFHCPVPFWGSRKVVQIENISFNKEMGPWSLESKYDRPIPRRILESAGVPREMFGQKKAATFAPRAFFWPFTSQGIKSFQAYIKSRGYKAPNMAIINCLRKISLVDQLVTVNLNHLTGTKLKGIRPHLSIKGQSLLFQWANHVLRDRYKKALPLENKQYE